MTDWALAIFNLYLFYCKNFSGGISGQIEKQDTDVGHMEFKRPKSIL